MKNIKNQGSNLGPLLEALTNGLNLDNIYQMLFPSVLLANLSHSELEKSRKIREHFGIV